MKKLRLFLFFFLTTLSVSATHIVGGGFTYFHVGGDQYILEMEFYRDCANGNAPFDFQVRAGIYDKATNVKIDEVFLSKEPTDRIDFGNTDCVDGGSTCLEKSIYSAFFTMPANKYNNTAGYYITWERCCRNNVIDNIFIPGETGMVFYLELPSPHPPTVPATGFINSSPHFTVDPINYICINDHFKYNFEAEDADGDSLVFALVTPLAGHTTASDNNGDNSMMKSAPYDPIIWNVNYGLGMNIMDGNPDLQIDSKTGEFSVVAKKQGLYVFTIQCSEYRNGVKLGEIRRDIQYTTVVCKEQFAPAGFTASAPTDLTIKLEEEKCFQILAVDSNNNDSVRIKLLSIEGGSAQDFHFTSHDGIKHASAEICLTVHCTDQTGDSLYLKFLVYDNSCPRPLSDTLRVAIKIERDSLIAPRIFTNALPSELSLQLNETKCFDVFAVDSNLNDSVSISFEGLQGGGVLTDYTFQTSDGIKQATAQICITAHCEDAVADLNLIFLVKDNSCPGALSDTLILPVAIINDTKPPKVFTTSLPADFSVNLNETKCFPIFGVDSNDNDSVEVVLVGFEEGNVMTDFSFPNVQGIKQVSSQFCITPRCTDQRTDSIHAIFLVRDNSCPSSLYDTLRLGIQIINTTSPPELTTGVAPDALVAYINERVCIPMTGIDTNLLDSIEITYLGIANGEHIDDVFFPKTSGMHELNTQVCLTVTCEDGTDDQVDMMFLIKDNSICHLMDTLILPLKILNRNTPPEITTDNDRIKLKVNQQQCVPLYGTDINTSDSISISYIGVENDAQVSEFSFQRVDGMENISTEACFKVMCYNADQDSVFLRFLISDNACPFPGTDTLRLGFSILPGDNELNMDKIPNVFTPNQDDKNDFFEMPPYDELDCLNFFSIDIYNRWGKKVYSSENPRFKWDGENLPPDTYFYVVQLNNLKKTGNVMIIR